MEVEKVVALVGEPGRSRYDLVEERRGKILDAAEQLIAVHGFDALRLRDVSKAAGVSIGLIQHYFTTRDELLRETMRTASARRADQWKQLASGHECARKQLTALLEGAINDRRRCAVWLETCAAATRHPDLLPDVQLTQDAWRGALCAAVEEGVARRVFSPVIPVNDIVDLLVSLIDGLMLAVATDAVQQETQDYPVQLLREAAQCLLRMDEASDTPTS